MIKALVDQSAVVVPEASAQNGHLQNALDIRNHILSNPNSTAHLQIKKKKSRSSSVSSARTESCSEGSTSELAQDQDETGVLLRAVQSKCQELEDKYTSRVLDDQRAAEEKRWCEGGEMSGGKVEKGKGGVGRRREERGEG